MVQQSKIVPDSIKKYKQIAKDDIHIEQLDR